MQPVNLRLGLLGYRRLARGAALSRTRKVEGQRKLERLQMRTDQTEEDRSRWLERAKAVAMEAEDTTT